MKVIVARALCFVSEYEGEQRRAYLAIGGASRKYCHMIGGAISSPRDKALSGCLETRF